MTRSAIPFLVLLSLAAPAAAQVNTLVSDNPRENANLKLGPFYVSPRFQITELGIDTNVLNEANERQRDFTATFTPSATLWVPVARRGLVKAAFSPDLVWYKDLASERSIDPVLTVRAEAYLRRFTLFAEESFLHSRQRPSFEIDLRSRRLENRIRAGLDVRLTPKITLEVSGMRADTEYDGDAVFLGTSLAETLNRRAVGFGATGRYQMSVLTAFALRAERFEERFPLSPQRGADNLRIMPGVEFQPRALINGSAYVGVRQLKPVDASLLPDFSGLVSDLGLSYTLLGSTTIGVSHTRDVHYSFEPLQPYYVATGAGVHVRRAIGPRYDVIASADRHTYSYRDLLIQPATTRERIDTIWNYSASAGYRFGREGRIGLGFSYWRRDSTTRTTRDYDGLRIGTTATYGF